MKVPSFDIKRQSAALRQELTAACERVLASGDFILGAEVESFEREIAAYLGGGQAVGVASGTDALWLALKAAGVGPGDQVLTSPFTFFATASAICQTGAQPVFSDIDSATYNLDPARAAETLAGKGAAPRGQGASLKSIKAILPVHLFGQTAAMSEIAALGRHYGIPVVEDACQAVGARYGDRRAGLLGNAGCFSFFPTKNLGACGDAGLVISTDEEWIRRIRILRAHGATAKYHHEVLGANSRLDSLQAAFLRVKLGYLDDWIARRRAIASFYSGRFADVPGIRCPVVSSNGLHTFHQYTLAIGNGKRGELQQHLAEEGIGTAVYYPEPLHLQPALDFLGYRRGDFPAAEKASGEVLSLPVFPELEADEMENVAGAVRDFFA